MDDKAVVVETTQLTVAVRTSHTWLHPESHSSNLDRQVLFVLDMLDTGYVRINCFLFKCHSLSCLLSHHQFLYFSPMHVV